MARLTEKERETLHRMAGEDRTESLEMQCDYIVEPTPEARSHYIDFATEASKLCRKERPVRFRGNKWKL